MQAARVLYFQKASKFDGTTVGYEYDSNFDGFVNEMEQAIGGTIYRHTAKKILNNWYLWALEQRKKIISEQLNKRLSCLKKITQKMKKQENGKEETK